MNRNFFLAVGAVALIAAAACTTSDGGDGGGGTGGTSTGTTAGGGGTGAGTTTGTGGSTGGSGGSTACMTCAEWATSCDAAGCTDPNGICDGDSMTAYLALEDCACGVCETDCAMTCTGSGEDTDDCATCLLGALAHADCSSEMGDCASN